MIRSLLILFLLIIFCLIGPLSWLIMWIAHFKSQALSDKIGLMILQPGFRLATKWAGARLVVEGEENLPTDQPVLYILNHRSIFDIVILFSLLKAPSAFVSKKELDHIPFFSRWMKMVRCLFLDRQNVREGMKTILKAIEEVKSGLSMTICPEGTRNRDQEHPEILLPFHDGSFKIAEKTGVPIIPIAMFNTSEIFEDHFPYMRKTTVYIKIGAPILISDLEPQQRKFIGNYMHDRMQDMVNELYHKKTQQ